MTTIQNNSNELAGKRALVTGGTRGIGEAIVKRLKQAGATVITAARSSPGELPSPESFIQADISTRDGVEKVVKEVLARLGGVDILINNVGGSSAPGGGALAPAVARRALAPALRQPMPTARTRSRSTT